MLNQYRQEELGYNPSSEPSANVNPSLAVNLSGGRQLADLTTRADQLSSAQSLRTYDYKSLLQEFEYLQKVVASLKISDEDKQSLAKLAITKEAPSADDVKKLLEISEKFIKENPVLPASDSAWYRASIDRLTEQQGIVSKIEGQSPNERRSDATRIRTSAIDELRADLPADKVSEIDKQFSDKTSKEAVVKLLELAEVRKKELEASFNADDRRTLERIKISTTAITKCDAEIAECNRLAPIDPIPAVTPPPSTTPAPGPNRSPVDRQAERKQHEANYYQNAISENLEKFMTAAFPATMTKLNETAYADKSDKISAMLKAFQTELASPQNEGWRGLVAQFNPSLVKFLNDKSEKLEPTADALESIKLFSRRLVVTSTNTVEQRKDLLEASTNLASAVADRDQWKKDFPNGTPDTGLPTTSLSTNTNKLIEQLIPAEKLKSLESITNPEERTKALLSAFQEEIKTNPAYSVFRSLRPMSNGTSVDNFLNQQPPKLDADAIIALGAFVGQITPGTPLGNHRTELIAAFGTIKSEFIQIQTEKALSGVVPDKVKELDGNYNTDRKDRIETLVKDFKEKISGADKEGFINQIMFISGGTKEAAQTFFNAFMSSDNAKVTQQTILAMSAYRALKSNAGGDTEFNQSLYQLLAVTNAPNLPS